MNTVITVLLIAIVVFALLSWTTTRETFQGDTVDVAALPDPGALFRRLREIIDRYDDPVMINDIMSKIDKDPGQLARLYIEGTQ
jgi:hypothetical protein